MKLKIVFLATVLFSSTYALNIDEAINQGISTNMSIQEKQSVYKEIFHDTEIAKSGYLPKLDFVASTSIDNTRKNNFVNTDYDYELQLTQNIFNGFKDIHRRGLEIAKYGSALYSIRELKNSFSLEIINAYIDLLKEIELYEIQKESLADRKSIFKKIKIKYDGGMGTQLEFRLSDTSLNLAKITLEDQKYALKQSRIKLERVLNTFVSYNDIKQIDYDFSIPCNEQDAIDLAYSSHPSVFVSKLNIELVKEEIEYSKNTFYPSVDLKAGYYNGEKSIYKSIDSYYDIYLQISYNIFNGIADYHTYAKSNTKLQQKKALLEKTKRDIAYKIKNNYYVYNYLKVKNRLMDSYVKSKELALESFYSGFSIGKVDLQDIIDTTESLYNTKKTKADVKYKLLKSKFAILEAIGSLPNDIKKTGNLLLINKRIFIVDASKLNIRKENNTNSDIIGFYNDKDVVEAIEVSRNWILTDRGWVSKNYMREIINE